MKKLIAIFIFCLFSSSCLFAQYATDWVRPADNYLKTGAMIARDNLDNVVITGYIQNQNIYTRKYDKQGNFLWERVDSSGIHSNYEKPLWVNADNSNNIFVVGYRYVLGSSREYPVAVVVLKYSASGNLLWKQTMNISVLVGTSHAVFNLRSEVDSNGNLYIGAAANSPSGFIFYKLSSEGTILVNTSINFNDINGFNSMRLKGNKVIMTGGSYDRSAATVVAWDTAGTLLWTNSFLGLSGSDVEIDDNGNIYLLSTYSNQVSGSSGFDIEVYKLNSSGTQIWKRNFDFGGQELSTRFSLVADRLSVIARGTLSPSLYTDWITFQLNSAGTLLWDTRYNGTQYNDEKSFFLTSKPNGDVFVTGVGGPTPVPGQLSWMRMITLKYDNTGLRKWIDTLNIYGGNGLACTLANDNSLFVVSSSYQTAYHFLDLSNTDMTLNLTAFIQGFYEPTSNFMTADTLMVYLRNSTPPYSLIDSSESILNPSGAGTFSFQNAVNGISYFVVLKHRNSIETWSASGQSFVSNSMTYDFSNTASKAYGNNMPQIDTTPIRFAVFSADVNQDGVVDAADLSLIDNASFNFVTGYVTPDVNGDSIVDATDASIGDNNAFNFVAKVTP